jgi:protein subunit release factor A
LTVTVDGRSRPHNEREARRLLRDKIEQARLAALAARRKAHRDEKISASQKRIRTYDLTKGVVKDHRTGNTASVKDILGKGKLEKLQ